MARPRRASFVRTTSIVGAALVLRLAVVWLVAHAHSAAWFFGQATELARLGESLRSGHGLSSPFGGDTGPSAFLAPGYPAIAAAVFSLFGSYSYSSAVALMCLQACFGAATVWALMRLTSRVFGCSVATVAGVLWGIAPPLLWLPVLFWETSLSILLATAAALLALDCARLPTLRLWLGAGLLSALALAVNPSLLPILLCCFGWAVYRSGSQRLYMPLAGIVLCILLCIPWTIRNYRNLHAFIPLRDNLGYELWQGNWVGFDGFFSPDLHPNTSIEEFRRLRSLGEVSYMKEKGAMAMSAISTNPSRFAILTAKRIACFWTGLGRHSSGPIVAYVSLTTILGFTGLLLLWGRDRNSTVFFLLPLLFFPLPYYMTHPDFRFRLVLDPILTALTAYALTRFALHERASSHNGLLNV